MRVNDVVLYLSSGIWWGQVSSNYWTSSKISLKVASYFWSRVQVNFQLLTLLPPRWWWRIPTSDLFHEARRWVCISYLAERLTAILFDICCDLGLNWRDRSWSLADGSLQAAVLKATIYIWVEPMLADESKFVRHLVLRSIEHVNCIPAKGSLYARYSNARSPPDARTRSLDVCAHQSVQLREYPEIRLSMSPKFLWKRSCVKWQTGCEQYDSVVYSVQVKSSLTYESTLHIFNAWQMTINPFCRHEAATYSFWQWMCAQ